MLGGHIVLSGGDCFGIEHIHESPEHLFLDCPTSSVFWLSVAK